MKQNETKKKKNMLSSHKKSILVLAVSALLSAGVWMQDQADLGESAGIVEREEEGAGTQSRTFSFHLQGSEETGQGDSEEADQTGDSEQELELAVAATQRSREESMDLLEQAVGEWEACYLGKNSSANEIRYDLNLLSELCGGDVLVSCESSDSGILQEEGTVTAENVREGEEEEDTSDNAATEGELVELKVEFTCGSYTRIETYTLRVLPLEEGSEEWLLNELQKAAEEAEEESREQEEFSLPDEIAGYQVIWGTDPEYRWLYFLLIGAAVVFCLEQKERQDEKERKRKRRERLLFEYPQMVDQFAILLDSGMSIRKAWERIIRRENPDRQKRGKNNEVCGVYLEEMRITYREIREGRGEKDAYERFGRRIGLAPYKRFSSILTQNLSKGTKDIRDILQKESEDALELRRNRARKMGEEAGTRLLFPMLVMLVMILAVLLLPALVSM